MANLYSIKCFNIGTVNFKSRDIDSFWYTSALILTTPIPIHPHNGFTQVWYNTSLHPGDSTRHLLYMLAYVELATRCSIDLQDPPPWWHQRQGEQPLQERRRQQEPQYRQQQGRT